ncbi:hypothetical protein Clacol_004430 [Clathrus columnatus]|uniref:DUF6533 domain-containing protein n=1 Tax=Clathrus columnatus TaxID=1419009 RepID=A0AAV5AAF1_9AGAM|nr:hypothetical protein Clacol_004430 [Clathrus columnatus]
MSLSTEQLVQDIKLLAESVPQHSFNIVAMTTLLIWDILLTFDDEVNSFSQNAQLILIILYVDEIYLDVSIHQLS